MKRDYPKLISMLLVVASLVCIIILFIIDINVIFEPPYLLPITNTIFTAIIPVVIAFYAAKTYLKSGSLSIFLMGCGMLSFGISAALAGWLRPAQNGANINVTIYNTGALIGSLFHIAGAVLSSFGKSQWEFERGKLVVASAYCGIFAFIILFTFATFERIIPPFFIQGYGPTALRQVVLGLAIFFYLLSAIFFMDNYLKVKSDFFYWYSLGLIMLAFGLFAFYIQKGVGSPIGWAGRATNYIGAIFALVAILIAIRSGKAKGMALEDVISSFFMDAEANFRSLVETASDAIISYDQEHRIILWNSGAERMFGYKKEEAVGAPFFKLLVPEEYSLAMEKLIGGMKSPTASGMDFPSTAEIEMKKKSGSRLRRTSL
ncbi:MAG TPA: PAS domain S-box protein, partial [Syntrophales bacterium]|nr:PAS domain S-box protein [Syntrophales bacterium]